MGRVGYMAIPGAVVRRPVRIMTMDPANAERLAKAVLASLDNWMEQCEEIASHAIPATGNAARALHLKRSLLQARNSLEHMILDPGD